MATTPVKMAGQTAADMAEQAGLTAPSDEGLVLAEQAKGINPDVAVGNVLMNKQKQAASTQAPTATTTPTPTVTNADYVQDSTIAEGVSGTVGDTLNKAANAKLDEQSQKAYDRSFQILNDMAANSKGDRAQAIQNIQTQKTIAEADTATKQRMEAGNTSMSLARMGGYLGGTGSATAYMNSLASSHRVETEKIKSAYDQAIEEAKAAYDQKDLDLASKLLNQANDYQAALNAQSTKVLDDAKKVQELQKYQRESDSEMVSAWAEAGKTEADIPAEYFDEIDKSNGYKSGTAKAIFKNAQTEAEIKKATSEAEKLYKQMQAVGQLTSALDNLPAGTPITIGDHTYYGTMGTGKIEIDASGYGRMAYVDQATGAVTTKNVGFLGKPQDGWKLEFDGSGEPYSFNSKTGQLIYAGDASRSGSGKATGADWSKVIPEGSTGGQCGRFVNNLTGLGVGDTLESKVAKVDPAIGKDGNPVQIGDVVVTSEGGWTGHVAMVNGIVNNDDGTQTYILTESNFKHDEKVTHTRQLSSSSSVIKGFARGNLDDRLKVGTDSPTFTPKTEKKYQKIGDQLYEETPTGLKLVADASTTGTGATDMVVGGNIVRTNADGTTKVIYQGTTADKDKYGEPKNINGSWVHENKATGNFETLKDKDGNEIKAAASNVKQVAYDKMKTKEREDYDLYENSADASRQAALKVKEGISTGPYKALAEKTKPWLTIQKDPQYADLFNVIELGQAQLRRGFFGTAVTASEAGLANRFLINDSDDMNTIQLKLINNSRFMRFVNDAKVARLMGTPKPDLNEYLKGNIPQDEAVTMASTGTQAEPEEFTDKQGRLWRDDGTGNFNLVE